VPFAHGRIGAYLDMRMGRRTYWRELEKTSGCESTVSERSTVSAGQLHFPHKQL